jgi:hypothetical protein
MCGRVVITSVLIRRVKVVERLKECGLSVFSKVGAGGRYGMGNRVGARWEGEVVISILCRFECKRIGMRR